MPSFTTTYEGNMLFSTCVGSHEVEVDSPLTMGGADRAATAPQMMIAALGSCSAMFAVQYCTQAGIDCEGLAVTVSFETASKPTRFHSFKISVELPNGVAGPRRKALIRAIEQCPVHLTMEAFDGSTIEVRDQEDLERGAA